MRAANSKLLGTKILELPKPFRVQTWKYLKNFSEVRTYLNSKFEFQVFPSLLENTLTHFLLLFDINKEECVKFIQFFFNVFINNQPYLIENAAILLTWFEWLHWTDLLRRVPRENFSKSIYLRVFSRVKIM